MKKNLIILALLSFILAPSVCAGYGVDEFTKLLIHSNTTDGNTVFEDSSFAWTFSITIIAKHNRTMNEYNFFFMTISYKKDNGKNFDIGSIFAAIKGLPLYPLNNNYIIFLMLT